MSGRRFAGARLVPPDPPDPWLRPDDDPPTWVLTLLFLGSIVAAFVVLAAIYLLVPGGAA